MISAHVDVAAAEGDDQITVLGMLLDILGDVIEGVDAHASGDLCAEIGVIDVVGVGLANRQDLGDDRDVGNRQRLGKVVQQQRCTAEGVRLEHRPYFLEAHLHRRG